MQQEITVGQASRLGVECADCGRTRWLARHQIVRRGISSQMPLSAVAKKLTCSACAADGLPGKNVTVQAFFDRDADRIRAECEVLRSQTVLCSG